MATIAIEPKRNWGEIAIRVLPAIVAVLAAVALFGISETLTMLAANQEAVLADRAAERVERGHQRNADNAQPIRRRFSPTERRTRLNAPLSERLSLSAKPAPKSPAKKTAPNAPPNAPFSPLNARLAPSAKTPCTR